jgi:3-keto-5-aminohexanoate cleavage enzyme
MLPNPPGKDRRESGDGEERVTTPGIWLEVALNGPWGRRTQPGIPVTVAEIVAEGVDCARAGAAIIHVHPYDAQTGRQKDDADIYVAIIEGIRSRVDAIVYPTIPSASGSGAWRYDITAELARRGLLEWAAIDPGTINLARFDQIAADAEGSVYLNPVADIRAGLAHAERYGFHPSYACYEPGFVRLGAALRQRFPKAPGPIYRLMFSDDFTFGFPPQPYALDAYLALLRQAAPGAPVMISGLGVDVLPLIPAAVGHGVHVRVGLEDSPHGEALGNPALVERAAAAIVAQGRSLAGIAEVRQRFV